MNKLTQALKSQQGAVTLFTSVILLVATTLVAFLTGKTVLQEIKIAANNYRASQAITAADAGMEYALAYFNGVGFSVAGSDHDNDGKLDHFPIAANGSGDDDLVAVDSADDFTAPVRATIVFYNQSSIAAVRPAPLACVSPSVDGTANQKSALIEVTGTSDDGVASRAIYQCVGTRNLLKGGGPKQSLVSGASVGLTGSAQIINRYADLNVWSAADSGISGSAMDTYIRPVDMEISDLTEAELISDQTSPSIPNVQKVSSGTLGGGTDTYQNDAFLAAAKTASVAARVAPGDGSGPGTFFNLFFNESLTAMSELADGIPTATGTQLLASGVADAGLDGLGGVIYVDGDASMNANGTTIGSVNSPAIIIVDGDFDFSGGTIYGLVYVTGDTTITGNPSVIGTTISEGSVSGTGTLTLVYARKLGDTTDGPPIIGTTGIISGSWRDW